MLKLIVDLERTGATLITMTFVMAATVVNLVSLRLQQ